MNNYKLRNKTFKYYQNHSFSESHYPILLYQQYLVYPDSIPSKEVRPPPHLEKKPKKKKPGISWVWHLTASDSESPFLEFHGVWR